jgi:hypothetical protein
MITCGLGSDSLESSRSKMSESQHEEDHESGADCDFETSSEDDSDDEQGRRGDTNMILAILRQINADMDLLTQMSVLMRRPGFNRKYLHSTGMAKLDSRVVMYAKYDLLYVEEKLSHWQTHIFRCDDGEAVATLDRLMQRASDDSPGSRHALLQRLATANTRRREQLLYWSRHPDQIPVTISNTSQVKERTPEVDSTKREERKQAATGATQNPMDGLETGSHAQKSTMTKNTYSTVAASAVPGSSLATNPEGTIYAESTVGNKRSNRVPDVPKSSRLGITFECPYCHLELDSLTMQDRQQWKYACCSSPQVSSIIDTYLGATYSETSDPTCAPSNTVRALTSSTRHEEIGSITSSKLTGDSGSVDSMTLRSQAKKRLATMFSRNTCLQ